MAKKTKQYVFTLNEIGYHAFKKWPGRWKNQESAYASVKAVAQRLEIGDINGKQKYKLIAAKDAARILEELTKHQRKQPQHGQVDLFSLVQAPAILKADPDAVKAVKAAIEENALTGPAELLTIQPATTSEEYRIETAKRLEKAAAILQDAVRVYCDCLFETLKGGNF